MCKVLFTTFALILLATANWAMAEDWVVLPGQVQFDHRLAEQHGLQLSLDTLESFNGAEGRGIEGGVGKALNGLTLLAGRQDGRLTYFISVQPAEPLDKGRRATAQAWQKLERHIKANSDRGRVAILSSGEVSSTVVGSQLNTAEYRVYDYLEGGVRRVQAYYLIEVSTGELSRWCWVTATSVVVAELHATLESTAVLLQLLRPSP